MQGFSPKDLRNVAGVQLAAGAAIALVLSVAFNDIDSAALRHDVLIFPFQLKGFTPKYINSRCNYIVRIVESISCKSSFLAMFVSFMF